MTTTVLRLKRWVTWKMEFENHIKYKTIKILQTKMRSKKTYEALVWKRKAKSYLSSFEYQYEHRDLDSWIIDNEVFDNLQRTAQKILQDF